MKKIIIKLLILTLVPLVGAAQFSKSSADSISLNPEVRHGILENGLNYYIFNKNGTDKIELRLVNKVGAYNYKDEQELELAHFIEHMSFQSTKHFPNGLRKFMVDKGLKSGRDLGATTTGNTVYFLRMPRTDTVLFDYGLLALSDWAEGRLYIAKEVEEEREALLNELSMAKTPSFLTSVQQMYVSLDSNPLYRPLVSERISNVRQITINALDKYDRKWYRPDLQALIVVGNVNVDEIEGKIRKKFASLKPRTNEEKPLTDIYEKYKVRLSGRNKLSILELGLNQPSISIEIKQKRKAVTGICSPATQSELELALLDLLYNELVKNRFQNQNLTAIGKGSGLTHYIWRRALHPYADIDALVTKLTVNKASDIRNALSYAIKELHRIELWGFNETEIEIAKNVLKDRVTRSTLSTPSDIANKLAGYFSCGAVFPTDNSQQKNLFLQGISSIEINQFAKSWISELVNTDVSILAGRNSDDLPDERQIFTWIRNARTKALSPYPENLIQDLPEITSVEANHTFIKLELPEIKTTKITLVNGIQVYLKQIEAPKQGRSKGLSEVFINAYCPRGIQAFSPRDYSSASISAPLIAASGIASMNNLELRDWLKNKKKEGELFVSPYINDKENGISGQSSLKNVDNLLHLIYHYFKNPRKEKIVFNKFKIKNESKENFISGTQLFEDSLKAVINGGLNKKYIVGPKFNKAFNIYKNLVSEPHDYKFVITGYFEMKEMITKVVTYFGGLENASKATKEIKNQYENDQLKPETSPPKNRYVTITGDSTEYMMVHLLLPCYNVRTDLDRMKLTILNDIFQMRLHDRLRKKEKTVYYVTSNLSPTGNNANYFFDVTFEVSSGNFDRTVKASIQEMENLSNNKIDSSLFSRSIDNMRVTINNQVKNPEAWLEHLISQLKEKKALSDISDKYKLLNSISMSDLKEAAANFVRAKDYILFKLI